MENNKFFTDERVRRFAKDFASLIARHFKKTVEEHYKGSIEQYKSRRAKYAKLLEEARKSGFKDLEPSLLKKLKAMRKELVGRFALPKPLKLTVYDKTSRKRVNVPLKVLKWMVKRSLDGAATVKSHGRDPYSGWQFSSYYAVDFKKIGILLDKARKEESTMTKEEKEAVYKKYADGKGAFTSPEAEIKSVLKKEKSAARRQQTIAKNAIEASIAEFAKLKARRAELEQKVAELEAEIVHLKSMKDLNSDIPEAKLIEYEELDKLFPDGIPEDFDWRKLSPSCRAKLEEDCKKCDEKIEAHLKSLDLEQQEQNVRALLASRAEEESDIPTEEELLESKKKTLSFRLQEFVDKKYLQKSEAERLLAASIYRDELKPISDNAGVSCLDTSKHVKARLEIAKYVSSNLEEFEIDMEDKDSHPDIKRWICNIIRLSKQDN